MKLHKIFYSFIKKKTNQSFAVCEASQAVCEASEAKLYARPLRYAKPVKLYHQLNENFRIVNK